MIFIALIVTILATVDYSKDRRFVELQQLLHNERMSVIRGKAFQTRSISVWDLVVGDVVLLECGSRVPADCLVLAEENLKVQEPDQDNNAGDFDRANGDPFLRAGSIVRSGNARALVCAVGAGSTRGITGKKLDLSSDTLLEVKLQRLAM